MRLIARLAAAVCTVAAAWRLYESTADGCPVGDQSHFAELIVRARGGDVEAAILLCQARGYSTITDLIVCLFGRPIAAGPTVPVFDALCDAVDVTNALEQAEAMTA